MCVGLVVRAHTQAFQACWLILASMLPSKQATADGRGRAGRMARRAYIEFTKAIPRGTLYNSTNLASPEEDTTELS